ncbi:MAG: hypothetical protein RR618_09165 [Cellulosilyticaceae bacterium]
MKRINHYNQATRLIHWDLSTGMPKNAASANIDALTLLSTEAFKLQVADEIIVYSKDILTNLLKRNFLTIS